MNCEKSRNALLLETSGELGARARARLRRHLDACPGCAAYRLTLGKVTSAARGALAPHEGPSEPVLARIREAGRQGARRAPLWVRHPFAPALAAAAALVVIAGGAWLWRPQPSRYERAVAMHALVTLVSEEEIESATGTGNEQAALQELAQALLQMQGLAVETATSPSQAELPATDPQSRSTPSPRARKCA